MEDKDVDPKLLAKWRTKTESRATGRATPEAGGARAHAGAGGSTDIELDENGVPYGDVNNIMKLLRQQNMLKESYCQTEMSAM